MLKVWNLSLIFLTFWLIIIGTFLTRSGVIDSVHAFAISDIGPILFAFVVLLAVSFLGLLFWRWPLLRSDQQLDGILSREASFLYNNLLFLVIALATLLGTIWPLVSEIILGDKLTVSTPFFDKVNGPAFLLLLVLMAAGSLLSWRRTPPAALRRQFLWPLSGGAVAVIVALLFGEKRPALLIAFFIIVLNLVTIAQEFGRGMQARHRVHRESRFTALGQLFRRNSHRYGGYIVHLGVIIIAIAIVGQHNYQQDRQVSLRPGESVSLAGYTLTYRGLNSRLAGNHEEIYAMLELQKGGHTIGMLQPKRSVYFKGNQPVSEVALHVTAFGDLYTVLAGWENGGDPASFSIYFNPLMIWLWIGGFISILGTIVAIWPLPRKKPVAVLITQRLRGAEA